MNKKILNILLFEDEESLRGLVSKLIERRYINNNIEYHLHSYCDPSLYSDLDLNIKNCQCESQRGVCNNHIDIIVTDINMPVITGFDFIQKKLSEGCKIDNVLFMSGYIDEKIEQQIISMGYEYLKKPFLSSDLYRKLDIFDQRLLNN